MTRWLIAFLLILMLLPGRGFAAPEISIQQQCVAQTQAPDDESVSDSSAASLLDEEASKVSDLLDAPELVGPVLTAPVLSMHAATPQRTGLANIPAPPPQGLRRPPRG